MPAGTQVSAAAAQPRSEPKSPKLRRRRVLVRAQCFTRNRSTPFCNLRNIAYAEPMTLE